jgi:hypothetical protein
MGSPALCAQSDYASLLGYTTYSSAISDMQLEEPEDRPQKRQRLACSTLEMVCDTTPEMVVRDDKLQYGSENCESEQIEESSNASLSSRVSMLDSIESCEANENLTHNRELGHKDWNSEFQHILEQLSLCKNVCAQPAAPTVLEIFSNTCTLTNKQTNHCQHICMCAIIWRQRSSRSTLSSSNAHSKSNKSITMRH